MSRVVLFVRLASGVELTEGLTRGSGTASGPAPRRGTCPRRSSAVADIPRTKSGKIVELAVRDVVHARRSRTRKRWRTRTLSTSSRGWRNSRAEFVYDLRSSDRTQDDGDIRPDDDHRRNGGVFHLRPRGILYDQRRERIEIERTQHEWSRKLFHRLYEDEERGRQHCGPHHGRRTARSVCRSCRPSALRMSRCGDSFWKPASSVPSACQEPDRAGIDDGKAGALMSRPVKSRKPRISRRWHCPGPRAERHPDCQDRSGHAIAEGGEPPGDIG